MESAMSDRRSWLPVGWFATLCGGLLGAFVLGAIALWGGILYMESFMDGGLEDLIVPLVTTPIGAAIGGALGAAGMLKAFGRSRPFVSGTAFVAIVIAILIAFYVIADKITPTEFNETIGVVLLFVVPPLAGAIGSRMLLSGSALAADE
jgi:hypothetical protein